MKDEHTALPAASPNWTKASMISELRQQKSSHHSCHTHAQRYRRRSPPASLLLVAACRVDREVHTQRDHRDRHDQLDHEPALDAHERR